MSTINEPSYAYSDFLNEHSINADSSSVNNLLVKSDLTLSYVNKNSVLITNSHNKVVVKGLTDNQLLVGKTGSEPEAKTLPETTNQVNVNIDTSSINLSLPQDIDATSNPTFNGLTINNDIVVGGLVDGVDISGFKTDFDSKINQGVKTTDSPTFNNLTLNGSLDAGHIDVANIDCTSIVSTGDIKSNTNIVGNQLIGSSMTSNRLVGVGAGGLLRSVTATSGNGVTVDMSGTTLTINTPQDLRTTANVTFSNVWLNGAPFSLSQLILWMNQNVKTDSSPQFANITSTGNITGDTLYVTGLTTNRIVGVGTNGLLQSLTATSGNGVTTTVSGTSMTINTPQDLRTSEKPSFRNLRLADIEHPIDLEFGRYGNGLFFTRPNNPAFEDHSIMVKLRNYNVAEFYSPYYDSGKYLKVFGDLIVDRLLKFSRGGGTIEMGVGTTGQASLSLYSDPLMTSHINFSVVKDASGNNIGGKYHISCRTSGENDELRIYRGPGLAGTGNYVQVLTIIGSGTNTDRVTFMKTTDATSRTNAPVIFKGGVGVEKTLYAKDIRCETINADTLSVTNFNPSSLYFGPGQSIFDHYEELWANNVIFYNTAGTMTPLTLSADIRAVRIGLNVTIDVRFNGIVAGVFSASTNTKIRSDVGFPQKFIGSRSIPPAVISVVRNGSAYTTGVVYLNSGNFEIWSAPSGDFIGTCQIPSFSMSYNLFFDDT